VGIEQTTFRSDAILHGYAFALGPTWLIQYTNGATTNKFDDDYAC